MDKILNKVTDLVSDSKEAFKDNLDKLNNLADFTKDKGTDYINQLIEFTPIIEEIGFKAAKISVCMGIPPSATVTFKKFKDIDEARKQEIIDEHKDKRVLNLILKTLLTADKFQSSIKMGAFAFESIDVNLGLTPGVNIQLEPKSF